MILGTQIPSIQTIHGSSLEYLLMRLTEIFKIPAILLRTSVPHLLVELRAFWHQTVRKRQVTRIAEIVEPATDCSVPDGVVPIQDLFVFNPHTDQLERQRDLATSTTVQAITHFRPLSPEAFQETLQVLTQLMQTHTKQTPEELNRVMNKII